jgi:hypothetical protein
MGVLRNVAAVNEENLVPFVEARDSQVSGRLGSHTRHDDGHALIRTTLQHRGSNITG